MSRPTGDGASTPDSSRQGGLSNVFRGLTGGGSRTSRYTPLVTPATAFVRPEFINTPPVNRYGLSNSHLDAVDQLKNGSSKDRIAAANTLRYAVSEYPLNPVLDIWYSAKDLILPSNAAPLRTAGWELLTECVKHAASTDLERKEYFQTLTEPAHPDDFYLQLAALVDLTNGGRSVAGFDYELLPLLTSWLQRTYKSARTARRNASSSSKAQKGIASRAVSSGEAKNFAQLFSFIQDFIKFSFNSADEASVHALIDTLLSICTSTVEHDELLACITTLDSLVTFGSIPNDKLKDCVRVLGSIYSVVPKLQKESWHTISNLCKSHNGQATVRILLDTLRDSASDGSEDNDRNREARGALAVLQKLLCKTTEKGYPPVPYALLVDGLSSILRATQSVSVCTAALQLLNSLFDDGNGQLHRIILDEDWSIALEVATECYRRFATAESSRTAENAKKEEMAWEPVMKELLTLVSRLNAIVNNNAGEFVPRQRVVKFFTDVNPILPDSNLLTILNYFQQFRCCSPSDLEWEENISLVLHAIFLNRNRPSKTRLRAFQTIMDAYEIVDLVGDGAEQNFIPRLARDVLQNIAEEQDIPVLVAVVTFLQSVVISCDMALFEHIIDTLKGVVHNDRLTSPVLGPAAAGGAGGAGSDMMLEQDAENIVLSSPSNVVAQSYVTMFLRLMNSHSGKSVILYNTLIIVAKSGYCETDARLTAMQLLFRLRADWANRIFVTNDLDADFLASSLRRTNESLEKRRNEEAMLTHNRSARNDHGTQSRSSRGMSIGQGNVPERILPVRTASGASGGGRTGSIPAYKQIWMYPDSGALPAEAPNIISPVLSSCVEEDDISGGEDDNSTETKARVLSISAWMDTVLSILQGSDWEIYSFVLVHLPSQLSNHAIFRGSISQIQALRRVICEQIRSSCFQEPPNIYGLRRADVAICLYQSLIMLLSYHDHFLKADEDDIVKTFVVGLFTWERSAKSCIHALSICCHELPLSTSKSLGQILHYMAAIITQPHVSIHILEFLACLSRLHNVYVNFREDDYRTVFGICFRYLDYARDKRQSNRSSQASQPSTPSTPLPTMTEAATATLSDDLPQYVHAIAYHVIIFWFLALKLPDRASQVSWIARKLFADSDNTGQPADEQALTSLDFMQRVTYADVDESAEDPYFTADRFGEIGKKRWIIGNSIVTVKQGTVTGWAQIVKRQPSGTSAYAIRESYRPPPPHQIENHVDITREGQGTTNAILPSHLLVQLLSPVPQSDEGNRPVPLPNDEAVDRSIRVFDRSSTLDSHRVGVVYIGEGQTKEAEILANVSGSADYIEFLNNLGTLTKLKGATFNPQGLDREYGTDGLYTFCWRDRVTEIVFHVTTQMPTNLEADPQCTTKKRHIGNDYINIVFNDSGLPFQFDTFPSQFNLVYIVITPASRASFVATREKGEAGTGQENIDQPFYMVQVMSKPGFPDISPASETKMISLKALPGFIRLVALNASMFSLVWSAREGGEHISSWSSRLREIKRLRDRYGTKSPNPTPSPPPSALGGALQGQQATESSRPSSTVRDSLNSFRRTSVATFFTGNSELPSHRSSSLSMSTTTNDTETGPAINGTGALVDSVDFSKWA